MKKTITANLNQTVYTFEEDAYDTLKTYLDSIDQHFSHNPDKLEIVGDIEARVSEKLSESLSKTKNVIVMDDVESIIASMGTVKDIAGDDDTDSVPAAQVTSAPAKKLFRDPDHTVIAGVASGIANYFGIDPVLVRLLFVVSLLFGGTGIIVYLVCIIAMPEAKTTSDKMQMYGEPITLRNIESTIKKGFDTDKDTESTATKIILFPFRLVGLLLRALGKIIGPFTRVIMIIIGASLILASAAAVAGLCAGGAFLLTRAYLPYVEPALAQILNEVAHPFVLTGILGASIIPFVLLLIGGIGLIRLKNPLTLYSGLSLLTIWIVSIVILSYFGVSTAPKFEQYARMWESVDTAHQQTLPTLSPFTRLDISGVRVVRVNQGPTAKVTVTGNPTFTETLAIESKDNTLTVNTKRQNRICVTCEEPRPVELAVTVPALAEFSLENVREASIDGINQPRLTGTIGRYVRAALNGITVKDLTLHLRHRAGVDLSGTGSHAVVKLDPRTRLTADQFTVATATVTAGSESIVRLNPTQSLTLDQSEDADVVYISKPKVTRVTKSDPYATGKPVTLTGQSATTSASPIPTQ